MPVSDLYYSIEDRWFDLLDWLEAKGIPVYKLIDPIEKAGIPSLPVFFAFFLIVLWLLLGGLGPISLGGGGQDFVLSVKDQNQNTLASTLVTVFQDANKVTEKTTDADGNVVFNLGQGTYSAVVAKQGCENESKPFSVAEGVVGATLNFKCGVDLSGSVSLCFDPNKEIGQVTVSQFKDKKFEKSVNCDSEKCEFSVEKDRLYAFQTSSDYKSTRNYTTDNLQSLSSAGSCVSLVQDIIIPVELGTVIVTVKNVENNSVDGVIVKIVNAASP